MDDVIEFKGLLRDHKIKQVPEEEPVSEEDLEVVMAALFEAMAVLDEREQFIVSQSFFQGHTLRSIASELGLSGGRVGALRRVCVRKLLRTMCRLLHRSDTLFAENAVGRKRLEWDLNNPRKYSWEKHRQNPWSHEAVHGPNAW